MRHSWKNDYFNGLGVFYQIVTRKLNQINTHTHRQRERDPHRECSRGYKYRMVYGLPGLR